MVNAPAVVEVDPAEAFSVFTISGGNVERTALVMRVPPAEIEALVNRWNWRGKLSNVVRDIDSAGAQREINRGVNYILAHRLRNIADQVVTELSKPEALLEATSKFDKEGHRCRDFKPLRDLADTVRTAQELSYRALGDSMEIKPAKAAEGREGSVLLKAMAAMDAADACPGTSAVQVVRQTLGRA